MSSALRRLASQSLVYAVAGAAGSLASFALTPLYARFLGPADFGRLDTLLAFGQIVTIVSAAGISSASVLLIIQPKGEAPATPSTALWLVTLLGLCWLPLASLGAPWLASGLNLPATSLRLVAAMGMLAALIQIPFNVWRGRGKAWLLASMTFVQVLLTLGANLYQVVWRGQGIDGILTGLLGVYAVVALIALGLARHEWRDRPDPATARQLLAIGGAHVTNSLSMWVVSLSDRFLLAAMVSATQLGIYSLGNKIATLVHLALAMPLALAWPGFLAQLGRDPAVAAKFGRLFEALVAYASGLFVFLVIPASCWCQLVGGGRYAGAAGLVPLLAGGALLNALQPALLSGFSLSMKIRLYPLVAAAAAVTNLALNLLLIPRWGAWGASAATLCAFTVAAVVGRSLSQRLWPLPVPWRRASAYAIWAAILCLLAAPFQALAWHVLLVCLYPIGAGMIGQWPPMLKKPGGLSAGG